MTPQTPLAHFVDRRETKAHQPQRGFNNKAQGNALGIPATPERRALNGRNSQFPLKTISPLQVLSSHRSLFRGRCPGLYYRGPFGADVCPPQRGGVLQPRVGQLLGPTLGIIAQTESNPKGVASRSVERRNPVGVDLCVDRRTQGLPQKQANPGLKDATPLARTPAFIPRFLSLFLVMLGFSSTLHSQITINVGQYFINSLQTNRTIIVPIIASGTERITDMSIVLQIGDGGPAAGGTFGPLISQVWTNGAWSAVAGASEYFGPSLPAQTVRFSLAVSQPTATVAASGELFRFEIDATGFNAGDFELKLANSTIGRTAFYRSGTEIPAVITNGLLRIGPPSVSVSIPRLALARQTNGWQLAFRGETGFRYEVQWSQTPLAAAWQSATNFAGSGQDILWLDNGALTGGSQLRQKFYRVLQNPNP